MSKTARQAASAVLIGDSITRDRPNITGHRVIGQVLLILARKAALMVESNDRKPCRCGPDMCADSVACHRR